MRGYGACCEELVYEGLGAVAGGGGEDGVGGGRGEGVGVVAEEVAHHQGVGDWFGNGDGAWVGRVSGVELVKDQARRTIAWVLWVPCLGVLHLHLQPLIFPLQCPSLMCFLGELERKKQFDVQLLRI